MSCESISVLASVYCDAKKFVEASECCIEGLKKARKMLEAHFDENLVNEIVYLYEHNNLSKADMRMLFEKVKEGKDDRLHKIIAFIVLPQYEKLREEFFEKLRDFPNIRQKIYKIYITKDNKNKMIKISDTYAQRIEWHLYRLYRVRNAIVHAGDTDRNIRVLGEHLHIYCDSVIIELITKLASNDNLSTVKDVLIDTKLLLGKKKEYLKEGGAFVDEDISHLRKEYL